MISIPNVVGRRIIISRELTLHRQQTYLRQYVESGFLPTLMANGRRKISTAWVGLG